MGKKVLLMGKNGSGKTSMRSFIFSNYIPNDIKSLGATIEIEQTYIRFLGSLVINLWDCGGQDAFMQQYFTTQRDYVFKKVELLIYVFDIDSKDFEKDMFYFRCCLQSMLMHSPKAKIFCLINKMDLIPEEDRETIFEWKKEQLINLSQPLNCVIFGTSLWNESMYKAWSNIVNELIPNGTYLKNSLKQFADVIEADEILLFEKTTFLLVSHCIKKNNYDHARFEKISSIIKQYRHRCNQLDKSFQSVEIKNANYTIVLDQFTPNSYIMVIISDQRITPALATHNIKYAQKHFENLETTTIKTPNANTIVNANNVTATIVNNNQNSFRQNLPGI